MIARGGGGMAILGASLVVLVIGILACGDHVPRNRERMIPPNA